jgi:hypothetical protein
VSFAWQRRAGADAVLVSRRAVDGVLASSSGVHLLYQYLSRRIFLQFPRCIRSFVSAIRRDLLTELLQSTHHSFAFGSGSSSSNAASFFACSRKTKNAGLAHALDVEGGARDGDLLLRKSLPEGDLGIVSTILTPLRGGTPNQRRFGVESGQEVTTYPRSFLCGETRPSSQERMAAAGSLCFFPSGEMTTVRERKARVGKGRRADR